MPDVTERRVAIRHDAHSLDVALKLLGRMSQMPAQAIDFSRFGIAVVTDRPLAKDQKLLVRLRHSAVAIDALVGVVHCCRREGRGYRAGIRFRPEAPEQFDSLDATRQLEALERALHAESRLAERLKAS